MRRLILGAVALGLLATPLHADAKRTGIPSWRRALFTVAKSARRLRRTRVADRSVTVHQGKNYTLFVRPDRGVVGLAQGMRVTGFRLGRDGKLSRHDARQLAKALARLGKAPSTKALIRGMGQGARQVAKRVDAERSMDPLIGSLMGKAKQAKGGEQLLWRGKRGATLSYKPDRKMIVGATTWSRSGFFVEQNGKLRADSLVELRSFLLKHR